MSELKWEEGKKYKLVDKEGFLADHEGNQDIFEHSISKNKGRVHIYKLNDYYSYVVIGYKNEGRYILFFSDIQFFEEVVEVACWEQGKSYKVKHPENLRALFLEGMQGREYITVLGVYPDIGGLHASCDVKGFELTPSCRENFEEVSTEDKVKAALQKARANKQTTPPSDVKMTHHAQMQIGKKGSAEVFEYISAVEVEGKYYLIQYNGSVPAYKDWMTIETLGNMKSDLVTVDVFSSFIGAVDYWEEYKHYHLNPYTFLMVQMLHAGNDLVKMGVIEI
ncbi:hypothetical protein S14_120 [Shewanella sp. phage 1/4]|uniref:hypothetical protein n=1 Tax=Shewanella phage 1/4 TaxID=1458859 RepID=UPI0004F6AF21|nr:hypothetical protein S14_120 [Shewanella sp. phage 1/4]AHK11229.1 hypothetical protein S14_120 [Shewanella sp. phage 1/4]